MSLIPKCPVEKPCEAETFEEAFRKNEIRLSFERRESAPLHAEMVKEGDPNATSLDPEFWRGCEEANGRAHMIYEQELEDLRERAVKRLEALSEITGQEKNKQYALGYRDVASHWIKALKTNDPSAVVYW